MRPRSITQSARRRLGLAALALITLVGAVVTAVATASTATSDALPPAQVLNYQLYAGGKGKANPKLAPITIGFINGQGGPPNFNFPQPTDVIQAAVRMVNAELGGIHGHPVRLHTCFIAQAEEEGVRCGQEMANDRNVKVILYGAVMVGNQSIYATIKGSKPIIGGVTANNADPTAKNAYFLNGSQTSVLGPFGTYTKRFLPKVKTVAIVYPNQPGADTAAFALRKGMQQVGVKVTMIATPQNATDLIGPATQASSADMIIPALGFTDCVPFARALAQIRYSKPVLSTPLCTFIPKCGVRGRRPAEVDVRDRADAGQPAVAAVHALPEEGPPVRDDGRNDDQRLRGARLGGDAGDREDHEHDPVQQDQLRDDQRRVQELQGTR